MNDFLRYLAAESVPEEADHVLLGIPFDGTASFRPGARFGPQGIRFWSEVLETYSPSFDADLEDLNLADAGDLPVSHQKWTSASVTIQKAVEEVLEAGKVPVLLGGEHLVSLPAVEACGDRWPDLVVLQLDAHMDLREDYEGNRFSHATVMRRVMEKVGSERLLQFGVRSGTRDEWSLSRDNGCLLSGLETLHERVGNRPVYISIDLDVLDPSAMPETGAPEPGGLTFEQLQEAIIACRGLKVVGGDVVEYCPLPGWGGPSGAVAAKVVRELIFLCAEGKSIHAVSGV